jgi:hypothetical protein
MLAIIYIYTHTRTHTHIYIYIYTNTYIYIYTHSETIARENQGSTEETEVKSMLVRASESLTDLIEKMIDKRANKELVQDQADFDGVCCCLYQHTYACMHVMSMYMRKMIGKG